MGGIGLLEIFRGQHCRREECARGGWCLRDNRSSAKTLKVSE